MKQKKMQKLQESPTAEEAPKSKVWDKYKALAAGQPEESPSSEDVKAEPQKVAAEQKPVPAPTGLGAIIQKYHQNKAQQSQMRTIRAPSKKPEETAKKANEEPN